VFIFVNRRLISLKIGKSFQKIKNVFLHKTGELFNNKMFIPFVEEQVHPITGPSLTLENNGQVFSTFSL